MADSEELPHVSPAGATHDRILIVDDNERHLDILRTILEAPGRRILAAASGEEALELLQVERVDVVVLDLVMPGLDGRGLIARIRALPACAATPVVVCTANVAAARDRLPQNAGISAVVGKPLVVRELLEAIDQALAPARPPSR
jgi:CheY-like chemotaxis protein